MRIRITYRARLRNLQTAVAESARTDCEIAQKYTDLLGKTLAADEGKNINYNCEAEGTQGDVTKANFTLNTDVPITMVNADGETESLGFEDINFNGDTAEASSSLQGNTENFSGDSATLKNSFASFEKYILKIKGTLDESRRLLRSLPIGATDKITMNIKDKDDEEKTYDCTFIKSSSELSCDTSEDPLYTTVGKVHQAWGKSSDNTLFTVEMEGYKNEVNGTTALGPQTSGNKYTYTKSSSGLSGGAIAGIVIACVVALAAASIAAIMLRKPSPPIDNTTIVDLKQENI